MAAALHEISVLSFLVALTLSLSLSYARPARVLMKVKPQAPAGRAAISLLALFKEMAPGVHHL